MSDKVNPGPPTEKQVRDHEARGGLWRVEKKGEFPSFVRLFLLGDEFPSNPERLFYVFGTVMLQRAAGSQARKFMAAGYRDEQATWTPCDQQNNPLPLVEELERSRVTIEGWHVANRCWVGVREDLVTALTLTEQERDVARAEVASVTSTIDTLARRAARLTTERNEGRWHLRHAARRVLELGRDERRAQQTANQAITENVALCDEILGLKLDMRAALARAEKAEALIIELRQGISEYRQARDEAAERELRAAARVEAKEIDLEIREQQYQFARDELDQARKANDLPAERARAMQLRLGELETDLEVCRGCNAAANRTIESLNRVLNAEIPLANEARLLLGDPGTPAGQALWALALAVREHIAGCLASGSDHDDAQVIAWAHGSMHAMECSVPVNLAGAHAATWIAILLHRRNQCTVGAAVLAGPTKLLPAEVLSTIDAIGDSEPEGRTCGMCAWFSGGVFTSGVCTKDVRNRYRPIYSALSPPDWCLGFEPLDVKP
jgi:hypothetical protein